MPLSARLCTASSIVLRGLSYVLLRWITGRFWPAILLSALLYFPLWHYNDAKLRYLEDGPARTLQKHIGAERSLAAGLIDAEHDPPAAGVDTKPIAPPSSNGRSYADATKSKAIVKGEDGIAQTDPAADNALTTVDPPMASDARAVGGVPARPSLWSLLTGAPTSSRVANRVAMLVNLALVGMSLDATFAHAFYPSLELADLAYTRVGAVGDTFVKISARARTNETARVIFRPTLPLGAWQIGTELVFAPEHDFVSNVRLDGLVASTQYECAWRCYVVRGRLSTRAIIVSRADRPTPCDAA